MILNQVNRRKEQLDGTKFQPLGKVDPNLLFQPFPKVDPNLKSKFKRLVYSFCSTFLTKLKKVDFYKVDIYEEKT